MFARLLGALRARLSVIERRWISDATEREAHRQVVVRRLSPDASGDAPAATPADASRR